MSYLSDIARRLNLRLVLEMDWISTGVWMIGVAAGLSSLSPHSAGHAVMLGLSGLFISIVNLIRSSRRLDAIRLSFVVALAGAFLLLGAPVALTLVIAFTLALYCTLNRRLSVAFVAAIAISQIPPFSTAAARLCEVLPDWGGLVILPVAAILGFCFFVRGRLTAAVLLVFAVLLLASVGQEIAISPAVSSASCALLVAVCLAGWAMRPLAVRSHALVFFFLVTSLWLGTFIFSGVARQVTPIFLLPKTVSSPGAQFFSNYKEVLIISGFVSARTTDKPEEILPNSLVVIPYAFQAQFGDELRQLARLPHYKTLRLIVFGEHTNSEGVAEALHAAKSPVQLNNNTTVPNQNKDSYGSVGTLGASIASEAPLNRGASVSLMSWLTAPVVWSVSGHSEVDLSEDGRLGDYQFRTGKRAGLLILAAAGAEIGGPSWFVIGDSTPALNEILVSRPATLANLISAGTGWPLVFVMIAWLSVATTACFQLSLKSVAGIGVLVMLAILAGHFLLSGLILDPTLARVNATNKSLYGDRAVGRSLVRLAPALVNKRVNIELSSFKDSSQPSTLNISIFRPDSAEQARLKLKDCMRVGGVQAGEVRILDGIACRTPGLTRKIGVGIDVVAFQDGNRLNIMDEDFISNAAPLANLIWLESQLE